MRYVATMKILHGCAKNYSSPNFSSKTIVTFDIMKLEQRCHFSVSIAHGSANKILSYSPGINCLKSISLRQGYLPPTLMLLESRRSFSLFISRPQHAAFPSSSHIVKANRDIMRICLRINLLDGFHMKKVRSSLKVLSSKHPISFMFRTRLHSNLNRKKCFRFKQRIQRSNV